jgi:hypothetical protein
VARAGAPALNLTIERGGTPSEPAVSFAPGALFPSVPWWVPLPLVVALGVTGLLLLVRAPLWPLRRRVYAECILMALAFTPYFCVPIMPRVALALLVVGVPLIGGLVLWTACELVPAARLWGPWQRALTWSLAILLAASYAAIFWLPDVGAGAVLLRASGIPSIGFVVSLLLVMTLAYRRSDALGRRKIKWIVYGLYVATLPSAVFSAAYALNVRPEWVSVLAAIAMISLAAGPLGFLMAIAFYEFLDIDRLFGVTLSYSLLAILGLGIVLGVIPSAARAASDALGLEPTSGQLFLSVGPAAGPRAPGVRPHRPAVVPGACHAQQGSSSCSLSCRGARICRS